MSLVITIIGLSMLVVVHELGHFLAARAVGMRVVKFSIGFGPAVVRYRGPETIYQLAAIPIGGYVQVEGLGGGSEGDEISAIVDRKSLSGQQRSYETRPLWQRTVFVAAGSVFNFLFAFGVFFAVFAASAGTTIGFKKAATLVVDEVKPDSGAEAAGLLPGDVIERIDGEPVAQFAVLARAVGASGGRPMRLTVARPPAGAEMPVVWQPYGDDGLLAEMPAPADDWPRVVVEVTPTEAKGGFKLGIIPRVRRFGAESAGAAVVLGWQETLAVGAFIVEGIGKLFQGSDEVQLGSVVKMAEIGVDQVESGWSSFLPFLAFISVNLGLLNLLPIPGLDGGRLLFIGVEAVSRRPVPPRFEIVVHAVGLLFLFGLIGFVLFRDIADLFF